MSIGDLIRFIESCEVLTLEQTTPRNSAFVQIPLWPTAHVYAGEIGVVLNTEYYNEVGGLCEVLTGTTILLDVPIDKIENC